MQSKPWYKSKIILLSIGGILVYGAGAVTNFLALNGVTPEQLEVLRTTQPQIAEGIEQLKSGGNAFQIIAGLFVPAAIAIARKWFTNIPLLR